MKGLGTTMQRAHYFCPRQVARRSLLRRLEVEYRSKDLPLGTDSNKVV